MVRASGLRVTGLQVLRDALGLDGAAHAHKLGIARQLLQLCRLVGAPLLLACSSTSPHSSGHVATQARDLAGLAQLAVPFGVKIGYEALSWGRHVNVLEQAWEVVELAGQPNLGVVVDAFHVLARPGSLDCLDDMPSQKIFLVQLSDFVGPVPLDDAERIEAARHQRVFPGLGDHPASLADLLRRLDRAVTIPGFYSHVRISAADKKILAGAATTKSPSGAAWASPLPHGADPQLRDETRRHLAGP
jgi:sugar phosphate isomerase/epimerase